MCFNIERKRAKMNTEWLTKHGFVVKHLFGKWYLVRLFADTGNPLHHIIFPMRFHGDTDGGVS